MHDQTGTQFDHYGMMLRFLIRQNSPTCVDQAVDNTAGVKIEKIFPTLD